MLMQSAAKPTSTPGRAEVLNAICDPSARKLKKVDRSEIKDRSAPITDSKGTSNGPPPPSVSRGPVSSAPVKPAAALTSGGGGDLASALANHKFKNRSNNNNDSSPPTNINSNKGTPFVVPQQQPPPPMIRKLNFHLILLIWQMYLLIASN